MAAKCRALRTARPAGTRPKKYNHLNLPVAIEFLGGDKKNTYIYNASGVKLQKQVLNQPSVVTTDYVGGFQYRNNVLQFFSTAEGYVANTVIDSVNHYNYVYHYKDHLGNIRMSYGLDENRELKILEENHYYPYGLKHSSYNSQRRGFKEEPEASSVVLKIKPPGEALSSDYNYKFNGMEWQDELGLNLYDYGARNYEPSLGRWMNLDPMANEYFSTSPYAYVLNRPTVAIDPDGKRVYFVGGAGNDADGWNYIARWGQSFRNNNTDFYRVNASHGKNGDVGFTAKYRNTGYESVVKRGNLDNYVGGLNPASEITNKVKAVDNDMINAATKMYQKELINNPLKKGEQFNLAGYSYGSVLQAQVALKLADGGQFVDNVILIGSPISSNSDLFKQLDSNKNIGNVLRYDIKGDLLSNPKDMLEFLEGGGETIFEGDNAHHFDLARPDEVANHLINVVTKWLSNQGVK